MNLHAAKTLLVEDRMDWHKPHVAWFGVRMYRSSRRRWE
ncbi:hypothetical protein CLV88_10535 [Shimia abyssi]|uniref:Uncharacterized protein n=1 Tax=Shimia abyssi TaxID=1662395 RepID=A0A2P8FD16_9RHOB|nr:hypothetical protein CLV88_10535 [Shimia abyssi]